MTGEIFYYSQKGNMVVKRRVFLTLAAVSVLLSVNLKRAQAANEEAMARVAADTAALSGERHPTIGPGDGMFYPTQEAGFTRITIDNAKTNSHPYGKCDVNNGVFDSQHSVLDFWVRMHGDCSVAFELGSFGMGGLGYPGNSAYGESSETHDLIIHHFGNQNVRRCDSLGNLDPINDGKWHHIVFDLAFAMNAHYGYDLAKLGQVSLQSIRDSKDGDLIYAGGPRPPLPATVDFRDMVIRACKPNEVFTNDLTLDVYSSTLGKTANGELKYLVAGTVVSRRVLDDATIVLDKVQGGGSNKYLGEVQIRKDFSLVTSVQPGISKLAVKLAASGKVLAEKELHLQPPLKYLQDATIHIIANSHQDIGLIDTQANAGLYRSERVIGPAIELLEKYPDYRFGLEATFFLMEYLNNKPFQAEKVRNLMKEGRLYFGSTYTQQYLSIWSGEALVRQLYYGRKWVKENVGADIPCYTAWNVDTPENPLQFPQVLAKSGVKYLMLGRFRAGIFDWYSPDGSKVTVDDLGMYDQLMPYLQPMDPVHAALQIPELLSYWDEFYKEHKVAPEFPISNMADYVPPDEGLISLAHEWNEGARQTYGAGFKFKFSTGDEFMGALTRNPETRLPVLKGEWVIPWGYIVPSQSKLVIAGREAGWNLTSAEKFWALRFLTARKSEPYQRKLFDKAWMHHLYFDHGPGAMNGDISDRVVRMHEESAQILGRSLLDSVVRWIAERATPLDEQSLKLVVLNPLSWDRTGPTTVEIPTPSGQEPEILDARGETLPVQWVPQPAGGTTRYVFEAKDIPSIGYSTLKVRFKPAAHAGPPLAEQFKSRVFENQFYQLQFVPGGLKSIYDKQMGRELVNPEDFLAGEVFDLDSFGGDSAGTQGYGETAQPSWARIEKASQYSPSWQLIESGPVRTGWKMEQPFREATIRLEVFAYEHTKRLDFNVAILHWSGAIYKEFRMAMPVNVPNGQVAYEVPYAILEVGKDELQEAPFPGYDNVPSYKIHPRFVQNWISAGNKDFTVALSSMAATWDYLDAHEKKDRFTLLQPILLATRKSAYEQGNIFSPPGDYHYRFALTSFAGGWRNNIRFGDEINAPFPAVTIASTYGWEKDRVKGRINSPFYPLPENPEGPIGSLPLMLPGERWDNTVLPSTMSLCRVSAPNYIITALKVADDQRGFIVRGYEVTGQDVPVTLTFPALAISQANATSLTEEDLPQQLDVADGAVRFEAGHRSINALRLQGKLKP
jgi:alpha-mannosidase